MMPFCNLFMERLSFKDVIAANNTIQMFYNNDILKYYIMQYVAYVCASRLLYLHGKKYMDLLKNDGDIL